MSHYYTIVVAGDFIEVFYLPELEAVCYYIPVVCLYQAHESVVLVFIQVYLLGGELGPVAVENVVLGRGLVLHFDLKFASDTMCDADYSGEDDYFIYFNEIVNFASVRVDLSQHFEAHGNFVPYHGTGSLGEHVHSVLFWWLLGVHDMGLNGFLLL